MSSARISSVVGWVAALLDLVYIISLRCRDFRDAKFYFVSVTGPHEQHSARCIIFTEKAKDSQIALKTGFRESPPPDGRCSVILLCISCRRI